MNIDAIVIIVLALASAAGIGGPWAWKKLVSIRGSKKKPSEDEFENRMRLVQELLTAVDDCDPAVEAVIHAGDVIARHWREHDEDDLL